MEGFIKQEPDKTTITRIDNGKETSKIEITENSINITQN